MPNEPRTVREAGYTGLTTLKGLVAFDDRNPILDALIGAQGRVVYTAEDVEAAANHIPERTMIDCGQYGSRHTTFRSWSERKDIARAAITAAGGVVADEVVVVDGEIRFRAHPVTNGKYAALGKGDTIHITRAKEE